MQERGSWYGKWRLGERQVKRRLGAVRPVGTSEGLTRKQAEAELRRLMSEVKLLVPEQRVTFEQAAERYVQHVEHVLRRKRSTVQDYRIMTRRHLAPHFDAKAIERIRPTDVESYITAKFGEGLAVKTITNQLNFAHGVFQFALRRGWVTTNPVALTERPRSVPADPDIRFLMAEELEALLRAVALDDPLGPTDHALFTVAAMTGLRQGELVALRWRDVDWTAGVVRVRRTFSRGAWGKPKSRRSSRAVPIADRVAAELERHFQRSAYQSDDDLAFCHPHTGNPYDASKLRERFYGAMAAAGMQHRCGRTGGITFHSLRHTFGTRMAAVGVPMRTLQEWMGHRDFTTTLIYADFAPDPSGGAAFVARAFGVADIQHDGSAPDAAEVAHGLRAA
ncbi:MAG TPA: site-specific integrase [Solirubrobacteraceae bacterium]|nr:site-specific integrase [Solirubrobacteraceae bacterium]